MLTVHDLAKTFTLHHAGRRLSSLAGVCLEAHPGRLTALVGPSGVGKSTVLKCIYRTYLPTAGAIRFASRDGEVDLATCDERTVLRLRQRELGFTTQFLHVLPRQPTLAVVAAPLIAQGVAVAEARDRAAVALRSLALPEQLWDLAPATFSGGEQQRVNLARSQVVRPRLLLLDEPTASLDARSTALVVDAILQAKAEGLALVAVFHDAELVRRLADDVVTIGAQQPQPSGV